MWLPQDAAHPQLADAHAVLPQHRKRGEHVLHYARQQEEAVGARKHRHLAQAHARTAGSLLDEARLLLQRVQLIGRHLRVAVSLPQLTTCIPRSCWNTIMRRKTTTVA